MVEVSEWAILVPNCTALFTAINGSCGEKSKQYMHSQPHPDCFNIEPCWACGEKRLSHTETGAEKHCSRKKQPPPLAVLWHP